MLVFLLLRIYGYKKTFDNNNFHDWKANDSGGAKAHKGGGEKQEAGGKKMNWSQIDSRKLFFNKLKAFAHTNWLKP